MPKQITQYRVFIGSPGGVDDERKRFGETLRSYTHSDCDRRGLHFHPVGWEDTLGGVGRPQALINADLDSCDFAVFVLHDHWGSPTGNGYTSGFHEEWERAEALYKKASIRQIVLFVKAVDPSKRADPGPQLQQVLDFQKRIVADKRHFYHAIPDTDAFEKELRRHLANWLHQLERPSELSTDAPPAAAPHTPAPEPGFAYWMREAQRLANSDPPKDAASLFCAEKALTAADGDAEWARATNFAAIAHDRLGQPDAALAGFDAIIARLPDTPAHDARAWHAHALFNKGVTLGTLERHDDALAAYDALLARLADDPSPVLRELLAQALFNKGGQLRTLGRGAEALAAYDDLLARFADDPAPALREQVAKALFNKGNRLGALGRGAEALAAYDDLIARFARDPAPTLREPVARALMTKGVTLGALGRGAEELAAYDDLIARFADDPAPALRVLLAMALFNKGVRLGALGRGAEELAAYDDLIARFANDPAPALRDLVANALLNKGITLDAMGRTTDAHATYDDLLTRFADDATPAIQELVAQARTLRPRP